MPATDISTPPRKKQEAFRRLYPINEKGPAGVAIGRYPEDRYNGGVPNVPNEGNPWVLLTLGFSELLHRSATIFEAKGAIEITPINEPFFRSMGLRSRGEFGEVTGEVMKKLLRNMRAAGDAYLDRARYHGNSGGQFSEQINRRSGFMQGAENLTWSYGAYLSAIMHRK
jgi:glucoamylase